MLMLKYDHQLTELKTRLPASNRILIVLPQNLNTDNLAAGLSLYLSLKTNGKKVDIVSTGTLLVSQSNLFGIGDVKNNVSKSGAGNFIVSLDGVVDTTGTMQKVPALENVDWYPEGNKLNVVFHVVPGQRFEPTNITWGHEQAGYDLTVVVGCQNLNELGDLFISNSQYFAQSQVVNIDNNPLNSYFGFANIIDPQASSLSEIVAHVLPSLTLSMDLDAASNIIAGIYFATNNLTYKVNPDTFMAVSQAVQVGGTLPNISPQVPAPETRIDYEPQPAAEVPIAPPPPSVPESVSPSLQSSPFIVPPQDIVMPPPQIQTPVQTQPQFQFNQPASAPVDIGQNIPQGNNQGFDLRQIFQIPQMPSSATPANSMAQPVAAQAQASPEERPVGEFATSPSPEIESTPTPDWLVPKIFKGGNLG